MFFRRLLAEITNLMQQLGTVTSVSAAYEAAASKRTSTINSEKLNPRTVCPPTKKSIENMRKFNQNTTN